MAQNDEQDCLPALADSLHCLHLTVLVRDKSIIGIFAVFTHTAPLYHLPHLHPLLEKNDSLARGVVQPWVS